MGILDRYQIKAGGWRACANQPWELDLDRPAVAGVALRDPATLLWKLGPVEDPAGAAEEGRHCYFARGVEARVARQRVEQWRVYWHDSSGRFAPFAGPCRFRGACVELRPGLREPELEAWLGPPVWRHEEGHTVHYFYAHHAADWEWRFSQDHGLQQLVLSAQPLYARGPDGAPPPPPADSA